MKDGFEAHWDVSEPLEGIILACGALSKEDNVLPAIHAIRRKLTIQGIASTGVLHDDLRLEALKGYVTSGLKSGDLSPRIAKNISVYSDR